VSSQAPETFNAQSCVSPDHCDSEHQELHSSAESRVGQEEDVSDDEEFCLAPTKQSRGTEDSEMKPLVSKRGYCTVSYDEAETSASDTNWS
jgi:hypothetical protein